MDVREAFGATAHTYDAARRQLIPCFDEFYGWAVGRAAAGGAPARVLDLGAGTGLLSAVVAAAFPQASFTLVDIAPEMLALAQARFAATPSEFRFLAMDYAREPLPGRFDLVVSALSIHHLEHDDKRALFARVYGALDPGGQFVNADQVLGPTPAIERQYQADWLTAARRLGVSDADLAEARARMEHDRTATLADQLHWLYEAGFCDVDCAYKSGMFAVMHGRRQV